MALRAVSTTADFFRSKPAGAATGADMEKLADGSVLVVPKASIVSVRF
jgi:hypothetical protein